MKVFKVYSEGIMESMEYLGQTFNDQQNHEQLKMPSKGEVLSISNSRYCSNGFVPVANLL